MANTPQRSVNHPGTLPPLEPNRPSPQPLSHTPPVVASPTPPRYPQVPPSFRPDLMHSPNLLSPSNGMSTGSPIPRMSTPPGPPVFNTPVKPAAVPFRTSPATPQPTGYSSATASSLPVSTPSYYSNGSSTGSQRDLPDVVRMEEPIAADSPYVLFSANKVLRQKKLANVASLGFGAIVSAGREISPGPQIIQRDPHRCLHCGAYSNPYTSILIGSGQWQCVICEKMNGSKGEYVAMSKDELRNFPELSLSLVDYVQTGNRRPGFVPASDSRTSAPVVLVIDECLDEPHLQHLQSSLHAFVDSLPQTTRLGVVVYGRTVSIYDFSEESVASADVISGAKSPSAESMKSLIYGTGVYLSPMHASLKVAHEIFSSLRPYTLNVPEASRDRCLGTAVEAALAIIQGPSAEMSGGVVRRAGGNSRIIVCAGGPITYGPGSVPHSISHPNYPYMEKTAIKWMENLGREAHRHNTVVDILCAGTCPLRVPRAGPYLGEVSSLAFLNLPHHVSPIPYLLAGSGSEILLYELSSGELIRSFRVFEGVRVHGTVCSSTFVRSGDRYAYKLVVFGEKKVKIFSLVAELESSSGDISVGLEVLDSLPRLSNWVFDVCFLKDSSDSLEEEEDKLLAIGCSDNSVCVWDVKESRMAFEIQSPERCLLYTMRLWGNSISTLRIASGTIFNEIIVWRAAGLDGDNLGNGQYCASHTLRLAGHEGSIFRIVWSLDGSKLVSVSDDRSARIWEIDSQEVIGPVLFGHSVRVWDCCISDSLIVTAGEDCTCRIWGMDGTQLEVIKEHTGRGIWRCLYDPNSSLLVTAGFDSAIKVHQLHSCGSEILLDTVGVHDSQDKVESFSTRLPNSAQHTGRMDSKSEYVRCLQFTQEDTMYVATNHGCLYHARLLPSGDVRWTELVRIPEEGPIIAMDVLPGGEVHESCALDDWVALGDGKGNMTIVRVIGDIDNPLAGSNQTWKASSERQLLGTFWCKSLGYRFVCSCNPRGLLKLWRLSDPLASAASSASETDGISLVAEFSSCFGMRIMCVDASAEDEVLVCGDLRGNITLFPLSKDMLDGVFVSPELTIPSSNYFKAAHGISTVSSLSVARLTSNKAEIYSTGADGCICYFEYDREKQALEFMGLKQLKELNLVQSVCQGMHFSKDHPNNEYAAGFSSTDFMLWNLTTETKVAQISCGGWRRPHSFYLGDIPEMQNCFAYVKDDVIHIHRHWVGGEKTKVFPLNLHTQFHGRELHSLCFISADTKAVLESEERKISDRSSWIVTGCEDGSVRLTRYASEFGNWSASELLGEHVGGSAVRSVCCVSDMHIIAADIPKLPDTHGQDSSVDDSEIPCLLISVGAKRVLTSWLLRNGRQKKKGESLVSDNGDNRASSDVASVTFQWLATDMPTKSKKIEKSPKLDGVQEDTSVNVTESRSNSYQGRENYEDDWRYMASTAFLVKCVGSRLTICFIAVACSDATLTLRALVLPHRLWFDVASLVPLTSPVLSLQHAIVPLHLPHEGNDNTSSSDVYLLISGATDGSIAFWDVTICVEAFVKQVSSLHIEKFIDCQKRPRTGRGSQGGRKWKLLGAKRTQGISSEAAEEDPATSLEVTNGVVPQENGNNESAESLPDTSEIKPSHVVRNAHQSGVNCLHVSRSSSSPSCGNGLMFNVISGGDDQALHCLSFNILSSSSPASKSETPGYSIRLTDRGGVASAHSSAIKGVWMDVKWIFSTGLDQRVRCWYLDNDGKLVEHAHIVISVPEPEALDAKAIDEHRYQIAVAGRGIQMVEFSG